MIKMDRIYIIRYIHLWLLASAFFMYPIAANAQINYPSFPSCLNPNGAIKVSYGSGTHGVPGSSNSYSGKDTVYSQGSGNYTQCLCTTSGDGVQTNWWKTGSITEDEIKYLRADNWSYVPDGSLWGLENASYMAKNSNYSCSSKSSDTDSGIGGGEVLGVSTRFGQVLGLATTGTTPVILGYIFLGTFFLILSRKLIK